MPWTLDVDPERACATFVFSGAVRGEEIATATRALSQHPDWRLGFSELWDGLAVTGFSFGEAALLDVVDLERVQRQRHGGGCVAVVTTDLAVRGTLAALLILYGEEHRPHRVFATRTEAEAWLGN